MTAALTAVKMQKPLTLTLAVDGMTCASCVARVERPRCPVSRAHPSTLPPNGQRSRQAVAVKGAC